MRTLLFYDLETTGLSRAFDQVLQFAAIRTDTELKEIERHEILLQLRPDVLPAPEAIVTNRIRLADPPPALPEAEAIARIHALFNTPETVSLGYNTLGFDDEFLRFAFYRNLLPPYAHQFSQGCGRMDLLPMAMLFRLFRPEVLTWPTSERGPSLRLEDIGRSNGLAAGPYHQALTDVRACLELARRFRAQREMWHYLTGCFDKQTDLARLESLPATLHVAKQELPLALLVGIDLGRESDYLGPVLGLGRSQPYPAQTLWLRLDDELLATASVETIATTTRAIRKKPGEPGIVLPALARYRERVAPERLALAEENLKRLCSDPSLLTAIIDYHRNYRYPLVPNVDADAALYLNGFPSRREQELQQRFHRAPLADKLALAEQFSTPLSRELAMRLICRNYPAQVPPAWQAHFKRYLASIWSPASQQAPVDWRGFQHLGPQQARLEIDRLRCAGTLDGAQLDCLSQLEALIAQRCATYGTLPPSTASATAAQTTLF